MSGRFTDSRNIAGITADPELMSTGEAAEFLGVSRSTLRRAAYAIKIHAHPTPGGHLRFTRAEVERYRFELHGALSK